MCRFETWPLKGTSVLQVCDLEDEKIQSLIGDETNIRQSCCPSSGWFTSEGWEEIQQTVDKRFRDVMHQALEVTEKEADAMDMDTAATADTAEVESLLTSILADMEDALDVDSSASEDMFDDDTLL